MVNRKLSVVGDRGLLLSVGVFAQKKDDKKQSDDQKKEIQAVVKMADDSGPARLPRTTWVWRGTTPIS